MKDIIDMIKQKLTDSGTENVYSAFDAVPVAEKGKIFTVIGVKSIEYSKPLYTQYMIYMPFRAEIEIKILAPESSTMESVCSYYETEVSGAVNKLTGLNSRISGMSVKHDKNISRLVLTVTLSAGGMKKTERETEEES